MKLSEYELLRFLKNEGHKVLIDSETNQHYFMMPITGAEVPVFVKVFDGNILVQMVAYLPFRFTTDKAADIARMLHRFNRDIDLPGFGMDEGEGAIFYRNVYPCLDQRVEESMIRALLNTTYLSIETFVLSLQKMANEGISMEDVATGAKPHYLVTPPLTGGSAADDLDTNTPHV